MMIIIKKPKILFVCPYFSSFIQNDLDLLRRHFDVKVGYYTGLMSVPKILKGVMWSDLTFSWFADIHAFWAVLFSKMCKKKSIVVVGGFEVANVPEINYGLMLSPISARRVKFVLKSADKLIASSKFSEKEILKYTSPKNVELVYNGVDCNKFKPNDEKNDNLVITVGSKIKLKGLDTFIESARPLLEKKIIIIGLPEDVINYLKPSKPANVELVGVVPHDDILQYYQKAKVYCQLSYRESFGMALAEAMACECVPVVTDNAALPEVVGDTGFYVPYGDPEATAEAIKEALNSDKGKEARKRIKDMFPIEKREKELKELINNIILKDTKGVDYYDEQK